MCLPQVGAPHNVVVAPAATAGAAGAVAVTAEGAEEVEAERVTADAVVAGVANEERRLTRLRVHYAAARLLEGVPAGQSGGPPARILEF